MELTKKLSIKPWDLFGALVILNNSPDNIPGSLLKLEGPLVLDSHDDNPAGGDEIEERGEGLVLVRRVGVEEAEGHHGAARLVQHHHVDATTARLGGIIQDLRREDRN